jgi:hypothetical protein
MSPDGGLHLGDAPLEPVKLKVVSNFGPLSVGDDLARLCVEVLTQGVGFVATVHALYGLFEH